MIRFAFLSFVVRCLLFAACCCCCCALLVVRCVLRLVVPQYLLWLFVGACVRMRVVCCLLLVYCVISMCLRVRWRCALCVVGVCRWCRLSLCVAVGGVGRCLMAVLRRCLLLVGCCCSMLLSVGVSCWLLMLSAMFCSWFVVLCCVMLLLFAGVDANFVCWCWLWLCEACCSCVVVRWLSLCGVCRLS